MSSWRSTGDKGVIDRYLAEASRHALLSREEERALVEEYIRSRSRHLVQKLVTANLRFVVKVAHEYRGYGLELADLIQEGNVGLLMAVERFDPERGYRLLSYAVWWIRAYIQAYVMRSWSLVKVGTTAAQRKLFFKLRSERQRAAALAAPGEKVSAAELAQTLGVREGEVTSMEVRLAGRDFSLNAEVGDELGRTHLDQLADPNSDTQDEVERAQVKRRVRRWLREAVPKLDEREQYILRERIANDEPKTLREIGERFRISRERARQIQERTLAKMRAAVRPELRQCV